MKYSEYQTNEKSFRSLTGISTEQFNYLFPFFEEAHNEYFNNYDLNGKYRDSRRVFVIYRNSPLSTVEERLFFILVYLKNNPLQEYHAASFGMEQKHCNLFIHRLQPILDQALIDAGAMPAEKQDDFNESVKNEYDDNLPVLLHDGTEREVPRPVDYDEQKEYYSGKKKRHTVKNAVVVTACCIVLFVSPTVYGKMHDKKLADIYYNFPFPCILYQDTGYQGYIPDGVEILQPIKKPKGRELTEEELLYNRSISSVRVRVEHVIGSIKIMRIVKDECRLRADKFVNKIFRTCAALHNIRIKINPWHRKNKST
jgi:hypothetical protein